MLLAQEPTALPHVIIVIKHGLEKDFWKAQSASICTTSPPVAVAVRQDASWLTRERGQKVQDTKSCMRGEERGLGGHRELAVRASSAAGQRADRPTATFQPTIRRRCDRFPDRDMLPFIHLPLGACLEALRRCARLTAHHTALQQHPDAPAQRVLRYNIAMQRSRQLLELGARLQAAVAAASAAAGARAWSACSGSQAGAAPTSLLGWATRNSEAVAGLGGATRRRAADAACRRSFAAEAVPARPGPVPRGTSRAGSGRSVWSGLFLLAPGCLAAFLGKWQWDRRQWKQELLDRRQAMMEVRVGRGQRSRGMQSGSAAHQR